MLVSRMVDCLHNYKDNPYECSATCVNCGDKQMVGYTELVKQVTAETPAIKFDSDKLRYDLIPVNAFGVLTQVYTFGAKKYNDRNWEKGMSYGRIFAATMRHCWLWFAGEDLDSESGLHHMAHAAFGCLALVEYHYTNKGEDDRPYGS